MYSHDLALTNLCFPINKPELIVFPVRWGPSTVQVRLSPRRNYQERLTQLRKTRGIIPATVLRFRAADLACNGINEFITDVCLGLSLVQGRKINWIYHATYGPQRAFQHAVFGQTITKAYTAQPLCFNPQGCTAVSLTPEAATDAIPAIKHFRETFDPHNRLINAWLDTKTETDYLEARSLKYVVVIEALNALTIHNDGTIATTRQDPKAWKQLYQHVIAGLPDEGTTNLLTPENWNRLNDKPFRDIYSQLSATATASLYRNKM